MLLLEKKERDKLWRAVQEAVERYTEDVGRARVSPPLDPAKLRSELAAYDFETPVTPGDAVDFTVRNLWENQLHVSHPGYFGMFNPAPSTMGIAAETLAAGFNPQLAAWSHSPWAAEVDRHVVHALGRKFGYPENSIDGALCNGGGEANHTAVLTALVKHFPEYAEEGARALPAQPVLYITRESHDTFKKTARLTGLGSRAVVTIPTDDALRMDTGALRKQIQQDKSQGRAPFLVVATLGTTAAGIIDPVAAIADVAEQEGLWLHADAAWGGAAVLSPELRGVLEGVERADSITFDAHKWFSVPMTAGVFLTRHTEILEKTFRVTQSYMPREAEGLDIQDPFARSMQWSRRFLGLKIFLSLAVAGWQGYAEVVGHMHKMGGLLKQKLEEQGWKLVNQTPLPLACFVDKTREDGATGEYLEAVAAHVLASGEAWISVPRIGSKSPGDPGTPCLRACITNYRVEPKDLDNLLATLGNARKEVPKA